MIKQVRPGKYETDYGNTCVVKSPRARFAYDIDMGEKVPIEMVNLATWRPLENNEE